MQYKMYYYNDFIEVPESFIESDLIDTAYNICREKYDDIDNPPFMEYYNIKLKSNNKIYEYVCHCFINRRNDDITEI